MTDFIVDFIGTTTVALIMVALVVGIAYFMDKISCNATARALSFTPHYSIFTGCVVEKPNGTRVLLDQIRNVGISKE